MRELERHMSVDVYGRCGKFKCAKERGNKCLEEAQTRYRIIQTLNTYHAYRANYGTKPATKGWMAVCNRFTISVLVERLTTAIFAVVSVLF